jgi:hypothetical protein
MKSGATLSFSDKLLTICGHGFDGYPCPSIIGSILYTSVKKNEEHSLSQEQMEMLVSSNFSIPDQKDVALLSPTRVDISDKLSQAVFTI